MLLLVSCRLRFVMLVAVAVVDLLPSLLLCAAHFAVWFGVDILV